MRKVNAAFRVVAFVAVFTVSAAGQQASKIDLPVEPEHTQGELTLADAARTNNYPLFDALYTGAHEEAPAFAELHRFWKWSLEDPIGAFYGKEAYAQFASRYPGYAAYIAEYAIVDAHGNVFYPSAETRRFLLQQAMNGNVPKPRPVVKVAKTKARVTHRVAAAAPVAVDARDARRSTEPVAAPAPAPVVAAPAPRPTETPVTPPANDGSGRAFALIIAGLVGVGLLTLMLRTPPEEHKTA
ncbi:MAG TPA: hypothetical protein VLV78_20350 [Thermoanaerobaculia bacterium]|nr:hypothetical protein [Thermoanaerobaculia bacterium]